MDKLRSDMEEERKAETDAIEKKKDEQINKI